MAKPKYDSTIKGKPYSEKNLRGTDGSDFIDGLGGHDKLYGLKGNDRLEGGKGDDGFDGGPGDDLLYGEWGKDTLYGAGGRDVLVGGFDADKFVYLGVGDSPFGAGDTIHDFNRKQGDKIELKAIDANRGWPAGNQDFDLKQLRYEPDGKGNGILTAYVHDGPDLQITLAGYPSLNLDADIIG